MDGTKTLILDGKKADDVSRAVQILQNGGIVAFPTETVYGLGANAFDANAIEKVFLAKGRPSTNPLIVHVQTAKDAISCFDLNLATKVFEERFYKLAEAFWPGPLTIIGPKNKNISDKVTASSEKVAVRVPSHPLALKLLKESGLAIVAPSANLSNRPSPTKAEHVLKTLSGRIDAVIDGGMCSVGIESTVVDISLEIPVVLRPGAITKRELEKVLGPMAKKSAVGPNCGSPGQLAKHYAPLIERVTLVKTSDIKNFIDKDCHLVVRESVVHSYALESRPNLITMPDDAKDFAQRLYSAFYYAEENSVSHLVVEKPADDELMSGDWEGILDRLSRASA